MENSRLVHFIQIQEFLQGATHVDLSLETKKEKYEFIKKTFDQCSYTTLKRKQKGLVRRYIHKVTGYSTAQVTRVLVRSFFGNPNRETPTTRHVFSKKYTAADILLLATTDNLHGRLNGYATKNILYREYNEFGNQAYKRISGISVSHIYNLRKVKSYCRETLTYTKTKAVKRNIGERRKPEPNGKPGYIRVDSVHQGDSKGHKGVYYINSVDEITQWQIVLCTEKISEAYLTPIILLLLEQYPFVIKEFHTDNGSEYINRWLVAILNKLLITLTKNRSRKTTDNAQCESKNNIIRKHMGYFYIHQKYAPTINDFMKDTFNSYLNFHKPCGFATITIDNKGKEKKKYDVYQTPYQKLLSIKNFTKYLKPTITKEHLYDIAHCMSDNEYAVIVQEKKEQLFEKLGLDPFDF
jgi:transposase InsO family protein